MISRSGLQTLTINQSNLFVENKTKLLPETNLIVKYRSKLQNKNLTFLYEIPND